MGRVKEFARQLAEYVYLYERPDAYIHLVIQPSMSVDDQEEERIWLQQQIDAVKKNPQIYAKLVK